MVRQPPFAGSMLVCIQVRSATRCNCTSCQPWYGAASCQAVLVECLVYQQARAPDITCLQQACKCKICSNCFNATCLTAPGGTSSEGASRCRRSSRNHHSLIGLTLQVRGSSGYWIRVSIAADRSCTASLLPSSDSWSAAYWCCCAGPARTPAAGWSACCFYVYEKCIFCTFNATWACKDAPRR